MQCAKMNNRDRECKKTVHTHAVNELNVFFRLFFPFTKKSYLCWMIFIKWDLKSSFHPFKVIRVVFEIPSQRNSLLVYRYQSCFLEISPSCFRYWAHINELQCVSPRCSNKKRGAATCWLFPTIKNYSFVTTPNLLQLYSDDTKAQ